MKRRRLLFIRIGQFRLIVRKSVVAGLFILAMALLILSKSESPVVQSAGNRVSSTLSPVVQAAKYPFELIGRGYNAVVDVFQVYKQNRILKAENNEIMKLKAALKSLQNENKALGELLRYIPPAGAEFTAAKVIAIEGDGFSHSLIIWIKDAKVSPGQVVLGKNGVVGRIESVKDSYARVILVTDINSKIPVIIGKNRIRGILSGDNTSVPKLIFTAIDADVKVGDEISTSGVSGFFPADLPIGRVSAVYKGLIEVDLATEIEKIEYVEIVDYGLTNLIVDDAHAKEAD